MKLFKRKMSKKLKTAINALADGVECGAKLHPQATAQLAGNVGTDEVFQWGTCALGAAVVCKLAQDGPLTDEQMKSIRNFSHDQILALYGLEADPSADRVVIIDFEKYEGSSDIFSGAISPGTPLGEIIWHLNDWYRMSREDIARFLRDLE